MTVLGYETENRRISPDKSRLQQLLELAEPKNIERIETDPWIIRLSCQMVC